ncbi:hypothetical protein CFP56_028568 [Quercus suber]|uniref:Uncharacterized protein n=1 Tax=Quercus suber TaxID=58331 RepID=A0AAW0JV64_QUESU
MTFGRLHLKAVEIVGFGARCVGLKFVTGLGATVLKEDNYIWKREGSTTSGGHLTIFIVPKILSKCCGFVLLRIYRNSHKQQIH